MDTYVQFPCFYIYLLQMFNRWCERKDDVYILLHNSSAVHICHQLGSLHAHMAKNSIRDQRHSQKFQPSGIPPTRQKDISTGSQIHVHVCCSIFHTVVGCRTIRCIWSFGGHSKCSHACFCHILKFGRRSESVHLCPSQKKELLKQAWGHRV